MTVFADCIIDCPFTFGPSLDYRAPVKGCGYKSF